MNTSQVQSRMTFLHQSAHLLALSSPAVAASLESECESLARVAEIELPADRREQVCGSCGNILITGGLSNLFARNAEGPRRKGASATAPSRKVKENGKRLALECSRCSRKTFLHSDRIYTHGKPQGPTPKEAKRGTPAGAISSDSKTSERGVKPSSISPLPAIEPRPNTGATASRKQRAKARKRGGLQAAIDRSRAGNDFGLDLMDLMKEG
ncbi:MAG: hypothetical protein M1821_000362 [Bathelium mastoideum]|nr:MAG: hypothetical protein M1821_000362 [Bathelium mastoideum]KAI9686171.1 MAG: hypothetical protein M1822_003826 [Bathelium mastoideum]